MAKFCGLLYVKHGRVGSKSEGPDYYLQTWRGDYLVRDAERLPWQPDYRLEFFARRMVEIEGALADPATIRVAQISELNTSTIPRPAAGEGYIGVPLDIRLGQSVQLVDEPVALQFEAILADTRRVDGPRGAPAGRCTIRLALVREGGEPLRFSVAIDPEAPDLAVAKALGYHVTLRDVLPHPTDAEPQPSHARCTATILIDHQE